MKKRYSPPEFVKELLLFSDRYALLSTDSILVAFSGGADSAVLLTILHKICQERNIRLAALHVNHMIRGEEAERDARFCEDFCHQREIPFLYECVDVPAIAKANKSGIEETARNERYRLLSAYAGKNGFSKIATAHNATDNIETVLFHLVRGMSTHGAGGIHPQRQNIIRPLLTFTKEDILQYAAQENIPFVTDSTNSDINYTRNHIRHTILPQLYQINPEADKAVLRFSESARQDDCFLFKLAQEHQNTDDTAILSALDTAILSRVLLIKTTALANTEIGEKHIRELIEKIRKAAQSQFCGYIPLPGNLTANITPQKFLLTNSPPIKVPFSESQQPIALIPEQEVYFSNRFRVCLTKKALYDEKTANKITACISQNSVCGSLYLRHREEGDRYMIGGLTRRIKKMLCDAKIPLEKRAALPILCDELGILYVPYLSVADRAKPTPDSPCYRIEITEL